MESSGSGSLMREEAEMLGKGEEEVEERRKQAQRKASATPSEEATEEPEESSAEEDEEELRIAAAKMKYLKLAEEARKVGEHRFARHWDMKAKNFSKIPKESNTDPYAYQAYEFRKNWDEEEYGPIDKKTSIPPSCFTDPHDSYARLHETLQIFSVEIRDIKKPLKWPLAVFGSVAVRDVVDRNRNMIFDRQRDNCQTIREEDPYLTLTGPTRAVVASVDPTYIEVDLKVRGITESEDKDLSYLLVSSRPGGPCYRAVTSKLSTLELTYVRIGYSVEAAISVKVKSGSWPCGCGGLLTASTASFEGMEVLLLSFEDDELPIDGDGNIVLSRNVVCVDYPHPMGKLIFSAQAIPISGRGLLRVDKNITPKQAGRSHEELKIDTCEMEVSVSWSCLSTLKQDFDHVLQKEKRL